jgi:hypothetical protein
MINTVRCFKQLMKDMGHLFSPVKGAKAGPLVFSAFLLASKMLSQWTGIIGAS